MVLYRSVPNQGIIVGYEQVKTVICIVKCSILNERIVIIRREHVESAPTVVFSKIPTQRIIL